MVEHFICFTNDCYVHHDWGDLRMNVVGAVCSACGDLAPWEVELHSGKVCGKVLRTFPDTVLEVKKNDRSPAIRSSYGRKIPTRYMIRYGTGLKEIGRMRRVYVMNYGNAGSAYIIYRGKELFLDTHTEYKLENLK